MKLLGICKGSNGLLHSTFMGMALMSHLTDSSIRSKLFRIDFNGLG